MVDLNSDADETEPRIRSYIKGFDGLRAIAAIGVIGFHLKLPGFGLGWSGVYLFFVLSGFLITRILLDAKTQPEYFRTFLTRRAIRIFPIYYLLLAAVLATKLTTGQSIEGWPWFVLYLQNYQLTLTGNDSAFAATMGHTWTLAIEEQFYWLWPIVVYCLPVRWIARAAVAMIATAWICRIGFVALFPNPILPFMPLPCAMDFLACGSLAAIFWKGGTDKALIALLIFALCAVALRLFAPQLLTHRAELLGFLAPLFLCVLIVGSSVPAAVTVLEVAPLRYLGRISYGLYLYHYPLLAVFEHTNLPWPIKLATIILVAALSFELIERPLLERRDLVRKDLRHLCG